jgi:dihydrodipicolinate synthase/N-acetylneuraminate lyase
MQLIGGCCSCNSFLKAIFSIDVDAFKRIVNYSIEGGIESYWVYCRENATLSQEEKN